MTNFIYDLNIVRIYYHLTKESLINCLKKLKSTSKYDKITLDNLLKDIISLNLNYLVLGSFAIYKERDQDYYKLLLTYYFYNVIIPILQKANNLTKLQDINNISGIVDKIPDGKSKENLKKFIDDINQQKIYSQINSIFMSKIKELLKEQEQEKKKNYLMNYLVIHMNKKVVLYFLI